MEKLRKIQLEVKGGKNNFNEFAKFNFRNAEQLFDSIKPLLVKYDCYMNVDNEIISIGDKQVIKSTVTFIDGDFTKSASSFAGIDWNKKGMDYSQACGCAQSYATKYALCSLLLLSDSKLDPDSQQPKNYEDNSTDSQNNNFTVQNNNVQVEDIRKAETIDELTEFYNRIQNMKSEKAKAFLTGELTKRKNKLLNKQQ